jgi:predicted RecA/RadA family phage recombinase
MSQKARFFKESGVIDYTMGTSDGTAGYPYLEGDKAGVLTTDLAAGEVGSLTVSGIWNFNKDASAVTAGDSIFWDSDGTDVDGDAGGGAATTTVADFWLGRAFAAAGTDATTCYVVLNEAGADDVNADITDNTDGTAAATLGTFSAGGTSWADDVTVVQNGMATLCAEQNAIKATLRKAGILKSA